MRGSNGTRRCGARKANSILELTTDAAGEDSGSRPKGKKGFKGKKPQVAFPWASGGRSQPERAGKPLIQVEGLARVSPTVGNISNKYYELPTS